MLLGQAGFISRLTEALPAAQLLAVLFLAILFLQSGIDKIVDRKGNLAWMGEHFAQSPLNGMVPLLLSIITLTEIVAGLLCSFGAVLLLVDGSPHLALWGAQVAGLNLLMLFLGQRLAKDYAGAATLAGYFLLTLFTIFLLAG